MDVNAELLRSSFRSLFDDKIFKAGKGFEVDTKVLRDIFGRPGWGVQALQGEIEVLGKLGATYLEADISRTTSRPRMQVDSLRMRHLERNRQPGAARRVFLM